MSQTRFRFRTAPKTVPQKRSVFEQNDLECARIIAADPERYPGLMALWAAAVLRRESDFRQGEEEVDPWA